MANLADTLAKPVGPLPLGAWIAVVGGGMGIAWYSNRNGGSGSTPPEDDVLLAEPDVGEGAPDPIFVPARPVEPDEEYVTFDGWIAKAIRQAAALKASPLEIERALRKYGRGDRLTQKEAALVNRVIQLIGPAPEGEITEPPSVIPPPPKTPTGHKYTFKFSATPLRYKARRSVTFRGTLLDNGKGIGAGRGIRVQRRHGTDRWSSYKTIITGAGGAFAVTVSAPNPKATQFGIRFVYSGAERVFTLKRD